MSADNKSSWTQRIDAIEPGNESEDYEEDCREAIRLCCEIAAELSAAQEEINRLTHNQRIQDSITAHVMERAEKAEAQLAHRNGEIVMAGLKVAELEAENEVFKGLYLNEQGRSESLRVDAERYQWMKREVKRIPPGWGIIGWDAAIDAERGQ